MLRLAGSVCAQPADRDTPRFLAPPTTASSRCTAAAVLARRTQVPDEATLSPRQGRPVTAAGDGRIDVVASVSQAGRRRTLHDTARQER
jgi:hypothetical protein